jgi:hypothetical protein
MTAPHDHLGALSLPVTATPAELEHGAVGDPVRYMLGGFLQAAIRAECQAAWVKIGGGTNVVERVEGNDPTDNTFSTTKLPCLAMLREERGRQFTLDADDVSHRESKIVALWVPPLAVQNWKARREPFYQAIEGAVIKACRAGRTPGWRVAADTDAFAATEGSQIVTWIGSMRPIWLGLTFEDFTITIEMTEAPPKKYQALKITFPIWEGLTENATGLAPNTAIGTLRTNLDPTTDQTVTMPLPE